MSTQIERLILQDALDGDTAGCSGSFVAALRRDAIQRGMKPAPQRRSNNAR